MTKITNPAKEDWATRGAVALQIGATLSMLSLVAVIAAHAPRGVDEASSAPAAITAPATKDATPNAKPYYFPSEYELNAPAQPEEHPPTF